MVFRITFLTTHSIFPLSSATTSAPCDSVLGRLTQTFVPEGFGPLAVLPILGCSNFSLTCIRGYEKMVHYHGLSASLRCWQVEHSDRQQSDRSHHENLQPVHSIPNLPYLAIFFPKAFILFQYKKAIV